VVRASWIMFVSRAFVVVVLLVAAVSASKLVYVEKPVDASGLEFVAKLASFYDVRGDYGDFVLVVDHNGSFKQNVVFAEFDDARNAYFVAEAVELDFDYTLDESPVAFLHYNHVMVLSKLVFAVPRESEDKFVGTTPFNVEITLVPQSPLPAPTMTTEFTPKALDPNIESYIAGVNSEDIRTFVTYLTGEATSSNILTRQAQSTGAVSAQTYLQQQFTQFGFTVTLQAFRSGYSSNVVATLPGTTDPKKLVLVTAHYDSRGTSVSSTTERAPGANDNGSGTGALLQIAKLISAGKISFAYTVVLIAFSGEEQGLYGSAYSAQQYKTEGADIVAVLNADMIAYRSPSEVPQLAFVSRSSTPALNTLLANISSQYVTGLTIGTTTACCTDHASFYNQGYAATSFYERNGNIVDPQYHKSGDLVNREGYDINLQYPLIVKAIFASVLTIAQYVQ
jgi:hypothetical protein